MAGPTFTVGVDITVTVLLAAAAAHGVIPVVVNVRVATPLNAPGGVHVAFKVFASGVKVPPEGVLQVAPVAPPPMEPPKPVVVPP